MDKAELRGCLKSLIGSARRSESPKIPLKKGDFESGAPLSKGG